MFPEYRAPSPYSGELFGVEYLYHQTENEFTKMESGQSEKEIDEGFDDVEVEPLDPVAPAEEEPVCLGPATDGESEDEVI